MNVRDLVPRADVLQGTRSPSHKAMELNRKGAELWKEGRLKDIGAERVARGLGWFSIGLGLAELLAPRVVARLCGGDGTSTPGSSACTACARSRAGS